MNRNATFQKSAKGVEAIATRQHGLGPKQRSMLILVDGKRGFDELARLAAALGDPALLLDELAAGGFVEPVAGPGGSGQQAMPAPTAGEAPAPPVISLPDAKRLAVRKLTDAMGPMAEDLCLRIEGARTVPEFQAAVVRAEGLLRQARGGAVADAFAAEVSGQPPRA